MADVGIEIEIDPSGAVRGERVATRSLDDLEKAADGTTQSVKQTNKALSQTETAGKKAAKGGKEASSSLKNVNGFANQASFQLQDFFVQVEGGTPILRAFSQQGSQLFSVINPLLGGIIGVGGAIAAMMLPNLLKATDSTKELEMAQKSLSQTIDISEEGVVSYTEKIARLAQTNEQAARAQVALAIVDTTAALKAANQQIFDLTKNFDGFATFGKTALPVFERLVERTGLSLEKLVLDPRFQIEGLFELQTAVAAVGKEFGLSREQALELVKAIDDFARSKSNDDLQTLANVVNDLNDRTGLASDKLIKFAQAVNTGAIKSSQYAEVMTLLKEGLKGVETATEQNTASFRREQDQVVSLSQQMLVLQEQQAGNAREAAILEAQFRLGANATDTYKQQVALLVGQLFDVQQAIRETTQAQQEAAQNEKYLESLRNQAQLIGVSAREAAILRAELRLGANATADQVTEARELAAALFDANAARKGFTKSTKESIKLADQDAEQIANLEQQIELLKVSGRERAQLAAQQQLSSNATAEQTSRIQELAGAYFDAQEAEKKAAETSKQLEQERTQTERDVEQIRVDLLSPTEKLQERLDENLAVLESAREQNLISQQTYDELTVASAQDTADKLDDIDRERWSKQLKAAAGGFSALANLAKGFAGEQAGIYRGLFAVSKAATLADVLLNSYGAISKAWNSAPFPSNLGNVALATIETGALQAAVEAVTPSFATGGLALGPGTGTSDSFTANLSNGEFVMPAARTRDYYADLEAMRAGVYNGGTGTRGRRANITVVNQTTGRIDSAEAQWVTEDDVRLILREELPGGVAAEVNNPYSDTNKAFQQQYRTERRFDV